MFPMMGGGGGGNSGQGRDVIEDLKDWWNRIGLFTKSLTYTTAVWRPFTAGFIHMGILQLLFVYLALLAPCAVQEQQWGTLKMMIDFFIKNFEIHMACNAVFLLISPLIPVMKGAATYGLWCFFMVFLTQRCLQEPEGTSTLCMIPYPIRNKYYPLAFILLFSIFGQPRIDMLMGYMVAVAHFKYLDGRYHSFLNTARISRWENSIICAWLQRSPIYITATGANPQATQAGVSSQATASRGGELQQGQPQPVGPFAGRGIAIGGSDPNDRGPQAGRGRTGKNYNQLDAEEDDDNEDDIESQTTNQSQN